MFKRTREIVILALMATILVVAQVSLAGIPNVELVSLLIIIYTLLAQEKVFYIIYAFVFIEGIIFGFGLWWISYLYVWSILAAVVLICKKNKLTVAWALISGLYGLAYGALCGVPYLFIGGFAGFIAYWISGIPFDIIHCISNFFCALVLFKPLEKVVSLAGVGELYYKKKDGL